MLSAFLGARFGSAAILSLRFSFFSLCQGLVFVDGRGDLERERERKRTFRSERMSISAESAEGDLCLVTERGLVTERRRTVPSFQGATALEIATDTAGPPGATVLTPEAELSFFLLFFPLLFFNFFGGGINAEDGPSLRASL